ncbi:MAG: hypothetical protein AAGD13_05400 [Pseudomonadota bacterium]
MNDLTGICRRLVSFTAFAILAACQPTAQGPVRASPPTNAQEWQFWFIDTDGYTAVETDTTDWSEGRISGTLGTTLVADCNGQDPTAFVLSIEYGDKGAFDYAPMTRPYTILVKSGGTIVRSEDRRPSTHRGAHGHEVSTQLASALRSGSEVTFQFQNAEPHVYTLKRSAAVMDRLGCDPNLL